MKIVQVDATEFASCLEQVSSAACRPDVIVPTPPPPVGQVCDQLDLVFLVDASGSIQAQNWPIILNFIRNVVNDFDIGPNRVQIGIATFGDQVNCLIRAPGGVTCLIRGGIRPRRGLVSFVAGSQELRDAEVFVQKQLCSYRLDLCCLALLAL